MGKQVLIYRCPDNDCREVHTPCSQDIFYSFAWLQVLFLDLPFIELENPTQEEVDANVKIFEGLHPLEVSND